MATPTITPLPAAPSRQNSAGTFATQADNFMSALPGFADQMNQVVDYVDGRTGVALASAESASDDAVLAEAARATATAEVMRARAFAANAAASANAAESAPGSLGNLALIQAMALLF